MLSDKLAETFLCLEDIDCQYGAKSHNIASKASCKFLSTFSPALAEVFSF